MVLSFGKINCTNEVVIFDRNSVSPRSPPSESGRWWSWRRWPWWRWSPRWRMMMPVRRSSPPRRPWPSPPFPIIKLSRTSWRWRPFISPVRIPVLWLILLIPIIRLLLWKLLLLLLHPWSRLLHRRSPSCLDHRRLSSDRSSSHRVQRGRWRISWSCWNPWRSSEKEGESLRDPARSNDQFASFWLFCFFCPTKIVVCDFF